MSDTSHAMRAVRADGNASRLLERMRPSLVPVLVTLIIVGVVVVLAMRGSSFYPLPLEKRVEHPDYRVLSPSGIVGQGYGVAGTFLILTNLLYLIRRRLSRFKNLGSMNAWLAMHVLTGTVGTVFVVFHSAFQLRTPIATVTAVSLFVVVITGFVGRYLYALSPTPSTGRFNAALTTLDGLLPGIAKEMRGAIRAHIEANPPPPQRGLFVSILQLPRWMSEARARRRLVSEVTTERLANADLDDMETKLVRRAQREIASLAASEVRSQGASALLRLWRGVHRFLAILMILSVVIHIGVAWFYGYRWIFSTHH